MRLSKEEYARKRIPNGSSVQIENTRVTVRHHSASLVMPNSYPRDGIFNQHLTTIMDSYIGIDGYSGVPEKRYGYVLDRTNSWWTSAKKELTSRLSACAVLLYAVLTVCVSFPYGI